MENGSLRLLSPRDIVQESAGQYALSGAARTWTIIWLVTQALGVEFGSPRSSLPVRVSFKHGKTSFSAGLTSNPAFHELVIGWPIGWTDAAGSVTGWPRWLQRSRGEFSKLISTFEAEPSDEVLRGSSGEGALRGEVL